MIFPQITSPLTLEQAQQITKGLSILTFDDNMQCDIKTIEGIAAGGTFGISHNLKKVPKYRIILRQDGGEYITDASGWDDKSIYLVNNGASILTKLTVLIM